MMMRALEAGGIPCIYSTEGDADRNRNTLIPGYVPNPHGFYEGADLAKKDWECWRGYAVKVVSGNYMFIPENISCRVVYMKRNPKELRRSYVGILSGDYNETAFNFLDNYEEKVKKDQLFFVQRGCEFNFLDYSRVVADPLGSFYSLRWPIDVKKAASVIDPLLYRHREGS